MTQRLFPLFLAILATSVALAQSTSAPGPVQLPPGTSLPAGLSPSDLLDLLRREQAAGQPARGTLGAPPLSPGRDEPAAEPSSALLGQFERFAREKLPDGQVTKERKAALEERANRLGLEPARAREIVEKVAQERGEVFAFLLRQARALTGEGELGEEDRRFLEVRGQDLGLDAREAEDVLDLALERLRKEALYRSVLSAFLEDGLLDASEEKVLAQRRKDLSLSDEDHRRIETEVREKAAGAPQDPYAEIRRRDVTTLETTDKLELYGRSLFQAPVKDFAPTPGLPPPESYVVGPGDQFQVSLWGRLEAAYTLTVDAEGRVQFPKVGPVRVGGLTYGQARGILQAKAESITGVSSAVTMGTMRSVQIFVVGEVERPGAVVLSPLSTAVHAVMGAGGPTPLGSLREVLARRGGKVLATLDLYEFLRSGAVTGDLPLESGDVVVVPKADRLVRLSGQVKRPAIYELRGEEGLRSLLEYAGGVAAEAFGGRIQVSRARDHESRVVLDVALPRLKEDFPLQDGDAVRAFPLPPEVANEVSLFGHVFQPGAYAYRDGMRLSDLIRSAERLKPEVELTYAVVLRESGQDRARTVLPFHLGKVLSGAEPGEDLPLQPRDQVYVFSRYQFRPALQAQATGAVRSAGLYRIERGTRVADLVRLAGGLAPDALEGRAELLRYLPDRARKTLYIDLGRALQGDAAANPELQDEDELVVHTVWTENFRKIVVVEGEVNGAPDSRFRRGKTVKERFSEMIADQPGAEGTKAKAKEEEKKKEATAAEIPLTQGMTVRDLVFKAGGLTKDAYLPVAHLYRTDPVTKEIAIRTFDLGAALRGVAQENLELQDLDHVVIHSAFDFVPIQRVGAGGMVNNPGEYPYAANMTVRDLVVAAGGLREEAYLGQAELVRTEVAEGEVAQTRTISLALERAMAGDPQANLAVKPYDKLLVKKIPEWRETWSVELSGEVWFPGTYYVAKGERLSSVLRRAGGYTAEAYPRGAIFTRESARLQQQRRLDELRERLQQAVLRASSAEAQAALSPEDVAAQQQYLAAQQALIDRLGEARATGRVVIQLLSLDELEGSEWDVVLEDGDALAVPKTPQTVSVVGQVYNPTSLLWEPAKRSAGHYLRKTGGPTPDAEAGEIYVVRADGTVVSPHTAETGGWWSSSRIVDTEVLPGDAILVPEKVLRVNYMKEIKDITQILYQIALTAGIAVAVF